MNRSLTTGQIARPQVGIFATILQRLGHIARMNIDERRLDAMPRERLEDMGIAPRTEANSRTSGERGPVPSVSSW